MADLLPGRTVPQIKSKLSRMGYTKPNKREKNSLKDKDSKEIKKQKGK